MQCDGKAWIRIRIEVNCWIRFRFHTETNADKKQSKAKYQYCGSVTFWHGSGSSDPYL